MNWSTLTCQTESRVATERYSDFVATLHNAPMRSRSLHNRRFTATSFRPILEFSTKRPSLTLASLTSSACYSRFSSYTAVSSAAHSHGWISTHSRDSAAHPTNVDHKNFWQSNPPRGTTSKHPATAPVTETGRRVVSTGRKPIKLHHSPTTEDSSLLESGRTQ